MQVGNIKRENSYSVSIGNPVKQSKTSFKGLEGIICDVDGTLVDTGNFHNQAWIELVFKIKPPIAGLNYACGATQANLDALRRFPHNGTSKEIIGQMLPSLNSQEIQKLVVKKEKIFEGFAQKLQEIDGLSSFLDSLSGIKKAIATCACPETLAFYFKQMPVFNKHFGSGNVVDASMIKKGKPNPEVYLKAAKLIGVAPKNCVVFEDTQEGFDSAKRAGVEHIVGVATGKTKQKLLESGFSLAIDNYTQINIGQLRALFEKQLIKR